jgi:hypothetical protein
MMTAWGMVMTAWGMEQDVFHLIPVKIVAAMVFIIKYPISNVVLGRFVWDQFVCNLVIN